MSRIRVGALTIGQSPRPDLVDPLAELLPGCDIIEAGALDGLTFEDIPTPNKSDYPLATQFKDGSKVMVAEPFIISKLQTSLESLEAEGVAATLLMCAGTFSSLKGFKPIIKPFDLGSALLQMLNQKTIGVIAPFVGQIAPIEERWQNAGFRTTVWAADLAAHDQVFLEELEHRIISKQLDCIVLDYFGHPIVQVQQLQSSIEVPVIDLGQLAIVTMASSLGY